MTARIPFICSIAAAMAVILIPAARADGDKKEPIVTDRPDFTESTETVPAGRLQLEGGYTYSRVGSAREHAFGEGLIRIAVGPRLEARLGFNSYLSSTDAGSRIRGFEDSSIGIKLKLLEGADKPGFRRPNIAVIVATSLPTGSRGFRESKLQPEAKLCLGWDLTDRLGLSANANCALARESGSPFTQFSGSISLGYAVTDRMGSYLETFAFAPASQGGPNASYLNGGFTYLVHDDFQLDARLGIGMTSERPDYFIGAGASRRW